MHSRVHRFAVLVCLSVTLSLLSGCGISTVATGSSATTASIQIKGHLRGGQQPISGASIQLYAASSTAFQGASTAMLTAPVTTAADGSFSITGLYSCPVGDALVYVVATGGNPGFSGNVNNTGIAMMSLIGSCDNMLANAATTFAWIDELTTVVAVEALAPFMTDYAHIGSAPSSVNGVGGAFDTATSEINFSTGQFSFGADLYLPDVTLDTLADIIASCTNTAGGSGNCSTLFSNTGNSTDTIGATLQMVRNPSQNTTTLYDLVSSAPPFQPYFNAVPSDFTAVVGYALPSFVQGGALDSNGHVWLYFGGYTYSPGTDTSTDTPGYIAVYDNNFNQLFTISAGTGGLYYPSTFAADANGHVFAINSNNSISEFDTNGNAVSPAAGWPTGQSATFSPTDSGNSYVYNNNQAGPIAVDALGNIWGGAASGSAACYFELTSGGIPDATPSTGNFCSSTGLSTVDSAAVDGSGSAWALAYSSISKADANGNLAATAPISQGCFYPDGSLSMYTQQAEESVTQNLLYDHTNNQLWGYSETGIGTVTDAGAAVFCNFGSASLPVIPVNATSSNTPGTTFTGGDLVITNAALDGMGNLWFATGGVSDSGVVGSSGSGYFTGTATYASYLGELSPSGTLLTPYNAASQSYGLQPNGFGANGTASVTNTRAGAAPASASLLGVDRFGNIWAVDSQTERLMKITGLAAANLVNYQ